MSGTDPQPRATATFGAGLPMPGLAGGGRGMGHQPRETERPRRARETLLRLWSYVRRQRVFLLITAGLVVMTVSLDLVGPLLLRRAIDGHIIPRDLAGLFHIACLMLAVYASSAAL